MTERLTALVTGVGGVYGLGCIENLRRSTLPIRIVGADTRWNAAGLFRSDATAILPSVDTGGYVDALLSCCEDERVDIVFSVLVLKSSGCPVCAINWTPAAGAYSWSILRRWSPWRPTNWRA